MSCDKLQLYDLCVLRTAIFKFKFISVIINKCLKMMPCEHNTPKVPKTLPILVDAQRVLFPGCYETFDLNHEFMKYVLQLKADDDFKLVIFGVVHTLEVDVIGTACFIMKVTPNAIIVGGLCRIRIDKIVTIEPRVKAEITQINDLSCKELIKKNPNVLLLANKLKETLFTFLNSNDVIHLIKDNLDSIPLCYLAELCSSFVALTLEENLQILNALDTIERIQLATKLIKSKFDKLNNKSGPKQKLIFTRTLPKPLPINERSITNTELVKLKKRIKEIEFPPEITKNVERDFQTLLRTSMIHPEYNNILNYLSLMVELPWNKRAAEILDLRKSKSDLEVDHFGLDKVKKRILEHLAVRKLRNDANNSTILCLVGPPGVGKTSIARSIAATLNRPFQRVSLGGVSNMADIRGHRRTYVSSMPGRIIQAIKQSGVMNPVILLDEIDKMTVGYNGNPAAALLEVLDPTQNKEFVDHYLNVPFDLSEVMFIATANATEKLSPALKDRLEVIKITSYTYLEKVQIVLNHLLPKQLSENGLNNEQIIIPEETIHFIISHYTREAGVRGLERKIGALCRSVAVQIALDENIENDNFEKLKFPVFIDIEAAKTILGPILFESNKWSARVGKIGVAIGLVVTAAGGDTCAVETSFMPGTGKLVLTGSLGDVMKESAQLAWGWVRSNAFLYGVDLDGKRLSNMDVYIHFPEGAVSKEGPSAGVTIVSALMSLFLDRPLLPNIAMTGEISLQGLVLPIGGVKNKLIAAHKDGFTKVILPEKNAKHLHDVPLEIKDQLAITLVSDMHTILDNVFEGGFNIALPLNIKSKL